MSHSHKRWDTARWIPKQHNKNWVNSAREFLEQLELDSDDFLSLTGCLKKEYRRLKAL